MFKAILSPYTMTVWPKHWRGLSDEKRSILLLSYFLDMTDREIADKLNMVRGTVQRRRILSLKEMKRRMEVKRDGGQSEE